MLTMTFVVRMKFVWWWNLGVFALNLALLVMNLYRRQFVYVPVNLAALAVSAWAMRKLRRSK